MNWSKPLRIEHRDVRKARHDFLKPWLKQGKGSERDFLMKVIGSIIESVSSLTVEATADSQLSQDLSEREPQMYRLLLREEFVEKSVTSIYLDTPDLKAFLLDTECLRDFEAIREFVRDHGKKEPAGEEVFLAFHVRVPGETDAYSYVFRTYGDAAVNIYEICGAEISIGRISAADMCKKFPDEYKLVLNLIYYVLTFPDALVDGKPKAAEPDPEHALAPKFSLKTHPKLIDHRATGPGQSRVTHFRRGHFRHLVSDWYKAKKGQWVFVPQTLVKGTPAKTLI